VMEFCYHGIKCLITAEKGGSRAHAGQQRRS
jgi:hypothetical protein